MYCLLSCRQRARWFRTVLYQDGVRQVPSKDSHTCRTDTQVLVSHRRLDASSGGLPAGVAQAMPDDGASKATASIDLAVADQVATVPESTGEPPPGGAASSMDGLPHEPSVCSFCSGGTAVYGQQQHVGYVPATVALHLSRLLLADAINTRVRVRVRAHGQLSRAQSMTITP